MTREPTTPHLVILAASLSILLAALFLIPAEPGESLRIGGSTLPNICLLRQTSGLPCPGCGLTRSLVSAVHADWARSLTHHRMGLLVLGYLILQSVARLAWLGLPRLRERTAVGCRALDLSLVPLLLLLVLNWIPTIVAAISVTATRLLIR